MSDRKQPLIVALQGSPRLGGNTDMLLEAARQGAADAGAVTEKLVLNELDLRPCQGCGGCNKTGVCVIKDDMGLVYSALERADGVILTSPIYFGGVTAQTKAMIDRCQAFWARKYLLQQPLSADGKHRDLLFLCTLSNDLEDQVASVRTEVKYFLDTMDGEYSELIFPNIESAGQIGDNWEALPLAREAGARLLP
jgi:multimeric flavodoxin WrbA